MASARVAPAPYWSDDFSVAQSLAVNYTVGWTPPKTAAGSVHEGLAKFQSTEGTAWALRSVPSPDFELSIHVPLLSTIRRTWRLHARTNANANPGGVGYMFHLKNDVTNDSISLYRNGVKVMGSTQWAYGQGTWPNSVTGGMRLSVVGGTVRAKWWTGAEPSEWGFEYVDANPLTAGNMAGFGVSNSGNRETTFASPFVIMPA